MVRPKVLPLRSGFCVKQSQGVHDSLVVVTHSYSPIRGRFVEHEPENMGGRFEGGTDKRVEAFSESISFDHRLYRHDIRASQAHAKMLAATGLLSNEELTDIVQALNEIEKTITAGEMEFSFGLEDIHTHIERALIDKLGDTGRKLHTARSRNDQIATDIKLWVRDTIDELDGMLAQLQSAFLESAQRQCDVIIPAYTHMQRAQPVLAGHYF